MAEKPIQVTRQMRYVRRRNTDGPLWYRMELIMSFRSGGWDVAWTSKSFPTEQEASAACDRYLARSPWLREVARA